MTFSSPFFLIGFQRSGTTFLREQLNSRLDVIVPPECSYITWLWSEFQGWSWSTHGRYVSEFVDSLMQARKFSNWSLNETDIEVEILSKEPDSFAELCEVVHRLWGLKHGLSRSAWGDKNNIYGLEIPQLAEIFSGPKIVWISRDPRAVWASERRMLAELGSREGVLPLPKFHDSVAHFLDSWLDYQDAVRAASLEAKLPIFELSFEEYLLRPQELLDKLASFLEVQRLPEGSGASQASLRNGELEYFWKKGVREQADLTRIMAFREDVSEEDLEFISTEVSSRSPT